MIRLVLLVFCFNEDLIIFGLILNLETINHGSIGIQCPPTPIPAFNKFTLG